MSTSFKINIQSELAYVGFIFGNQVQRVVRGQTEFENHCTSRSIASLILKLHVIGTDGKVRHVMNEIVP